MTDRAAIRLPDSISAGKHDTPEHGMCVMETVAYIAGEPHTDHPECACPVITQFAIAVNDKMPDDETRTRILGPLVWRIAGTRSTREVEQRRAYMCADWAIRAIAPLALEAAGLGYEAAKLRALPEVRDMESATAAAYAASDAASDASALSTVPAVHAYAATYRASLLGIDDAATAAFYANANVPGTWERCGELIERLCEVPHD